MLLRAGLLYALSALCVLLVVGVFWGRLELGASREEALALSERVQQLQGQLEAEQRKVDAAQRRALVAEDSLQKAQVNKAEMETGANETRLKFTQELTAALRARDQARREAARLTQELETAQSLLRVAQMGAAAARADTERLRAERTRREVEAMSKVSPPAKGTGAPLASQSPMVSTASIGREPKMAERVLDPNAAFGTVETYTIIPAQAAAAASAAAAANQAVKQKSGTVSGKQGSVQKEPKPKKKPDQKAAQDKSRKAQKPAADARPREGKAIGATGPAVTFQ